MDDHELERIYRGYITALNERRFDDLSTFVHDELTYNGEPWTRERYQSWLADSADKIPDPSYSIQLLVAGAGHAGFSSDDGFPQPAHFHGRRRQS